MTCLKRKWCAGQNLRAVFTHSAVKIAGIASIGCFYHVLCAITVGFLFIVYELVISDATILRRFYLISEHVLLMLTAG